MSGQSLKIFLWFVWTTSGILRFSKFSSGRRKWLPKVPNLSGWAGFKKRWFCPDANKRLQKLQIMFGLQGRDVLSILLCSNTKEITSQYVPISQSELLKVSAAQAKSTVLTTALNADASLPSAYHRNISKHLSCVLCTWKIHEIFLEPQQGKWKCIGVNIGKMLAEENTALTSHKKFPPCHKFMV